MQSISKESVTENSSIWRPIAFGGLLAGALDLTAACVNSGLRGVSPITVFQSIAGGLYGAETYKGGLATAALGVLLHFVIAFGATIAFCLASRKIKFLVRQWIISGIIYGVAVYWFMQLIVLPLSAFPHRAQPPVSSVIIGILIHIFCVGLPIAYVTKRFSA